MRQQAATRTQVHTSPVADDTVVDGERQDRPIIQSRATTDDGISKADRIVVGPQPVPETYVVVGVGLICPSRHISASGPKPTPAHLLEGFDEVASLGELHPASRGAVGVQPDLTKAKIETLVDITLVARHASYIRVPVAALDVVRTENTVRDNLTVIGTTATGAWTQKDLTTFTAAASTGTCE
jgi:hypothetical protein